MGDDFCPDGTPGVTKLYSLTTHTWKEVSWESKELRVCGQPSDTNYCDFAPTALGKQWIEFSLSYTGTGCGCIQAEYFENIYSGQWRKTATTFSQTHASLRGINAHTMLDLDSPSLVRAVCRPITLPHNGQLLIRPPQLAVSPVVFYGPFAFVGRVAYPFHFYLQRCGSHQRLKIAEPGSANSKIILTGPSQGTVMASRRRFTFQLPAQLHGTSTEVSGAHIFASDNLNQVLWAAELPRAMQGR